MALLDLVPLTLVVVTLVLYLGSKGDGRISRVVARLARAIFGGVVTEDRERKRVIESAYIGETYRTYAAKTYLFALLGTVGGGLGAAYVVAGALLVTEPVVRKLAELPNTISGTLGFTKNFQLVLSDGLYWGLLGGAFLLGGIVVGALAYLFRWKLPASNADVRRRSIEEGLPRTTAFMYALSRGGITAPGMMRALAENDDIYGESAREMRLAVREMDLFGRDMITAIRRMAGRTPSDQFKTFAENLASVLQSGSSMPDFLREQYERFREEAEERQTEVLDLLATIAEGYVTVMVAGVLFLITILLVFGLTTTDTLPFIQAIAYLIVPLSNAGFAVFLAQKLELLGIADRSSGEVLDLLSVETPTRAHPNRDTDGRRADGGLAQNQESRAALDRYDSLNRIKQAVGSPLRTVLWNPAAVLYVLVPVALLAFGLRLPEALTGIGVNVRILDDLVVQSVLLVLIGYGVVRELYKRRIDRIEAALPELLERLASLNEAGMTVVEGLDRVRGGDLGVLSPEVERIWRDVSYGANVDDALVRFGRRVRTTAISRVVVLLDHAIRASGNVGEVLRVAAEQAQSDLQLRRRRRQQMLTYLIVIYIAFAVFLVIIVAVNQVLVPSLPEGVPTPSSAETGRLGVNVGQFTRFGSVDKSAYTLVFFHTALVQALCSGFIAGQLGNGSLRDGAKHAAAMLTIAYVVFVLISSPVSALPAAGVGLDDGGETLTVESVSLSDGGFVVVREGGINGTLLGESGYVEPGRHEDVRIPLQGRVSGGAEIHVTTHRDTDGDRRYSFDGPYVPGRGQTDGPYPTLSNAGSAGQTVVINNTGR